MQANECYVSESDDVRDRDSLDIDYHDGLDLFKRSASNASLLLGLIEKCDETLTPLKQLELRLAAFAEYLSLKLRIFQGRVWRRLEGAGIPGDHAPDLVQQAAVKALRALETGKYEEKIGRFEHWFSTIVSNTVRDHVRRERAERQALRDASERGMLPGLRMPRPGRATLAETQIEPLATSRIETRQQLELIDQALNRQLSSARPRERALLETFRSELVLRIRESWEDGVSLRRLYDTAYVGLGWRGTYEAFKRARQRAVKKVLDEAGRAS